MPIFKAKKSEKAFVTSQDFYKVYNSLKKSLFGGKDAPLSKMRGKALAKVKAWSAETDETHNEYLELLQKVIEIDGLPDYAQITNSKSLEGVQNKISLSYLERILDASEKIDAEPENVILAEELL